MSKEDRKLREEKFYEAGWGMWFRNSDNKKIVVKCQLYPKTRLWYEDEEGEHAITKTELDINYHRLRL